MRHRGKVTKHVPTSQPLEGGSPSQKRRRHYRGLFTLFQPLQRPARSAAPAHARFWLSYLIEFQALHPVCAGPAPTGFKTFELKWGERSGQSKSIKGAVLMREHRHRCLFSASLLRACSKLEAERASRGCLGNLTGYALGNG